MISLGLVFIDLSSLVITSLSSFNIAQVQKLCWETGHPPLEDKSDSDDIESNQGINEEDFPDVGENGNDIMCNAQSGENTVVGYSW